jgi:hypothetical protein
MLLAAAAAAAAFGEVTNTVASHRHASPQLPRSGCAVVDFGHTPVSASLLRMPSPPPDFFVACSVQHVAHFLKRSAEYQTVLQQLLQ